MSYPDSHGEQTGHWARHGGAAPDAYAETGSGANGGGWQPEGWDQPAAAYPVSGDDPAWNSPTAPVAGEPVPRGARGKRRAGRSPRPSPGEPTTSRAGRNLPAAVGVGSGLGAVLLAALFLWEPALLGVIAVAAGIGIWEMVRAVEADDARPPLLPLVAGGLLMTGLAWWAGTDGLTMALLVTVCAALLWRLADGVAALRRDLTSTVLIAVYVPFLLSFAVLMRDQPDGEWRVLAVLLAVVLSDTGGYAFGVFLGKHPMAPKISPKKSWEGFGGSVFSAALGSGILLALAVDGANFLEGALFGAVIAVVAVLGDLTESMMKRDLGIKDMSSLLPGHGGLMDRLDSILFAVPAAYLLLSLIAPVS
ncbi:phosphatidate cytidylyltransferase [Spirilliplanes yamanashiensis]|uniref:Phosphatidate cytidylyltransferase n=1 Tax=Spirilliplanes yamanashiensis TaxID=42233 RepID=A0A8J4DHQ9_9ACTN|nr:phosphatidate cytidylyltransferase [Spirilliplanes yamanashiensis]MDP9819682.1 phosphatidate cytidylyltransferase [Spirilliplanes yamanashiensis]GIJ01498.1 hypothetical protein Sya03_08500 [Spirilliplanes yamanashiensis]